MKKISILLTIAVVIGLLSTAAFAATAPQASLNTGTAEKGGTVQLTLSLSGCSGFSNMGFEISYDATVLTLTSVTPNADVGALCTTAQSYSKNPYNISWDSVTNTVYNGDLATFTFTVAEEVPVGVYPVTLSYYKGINDNYIDGYDVNYDENFSSLGLSYVSGSITIGNATDVCISATEASTPQQVIIDITLKSSDYKGTILTGLYSENKLVALKMYDAKNTVQVAFDEGDTGTYVKIFWWDNPKTMENLCEPKTVIVNN